MHQRRQLRKRRPRRRLPNQDSCSRNQTFVASAVGVLVLILAFGIYWKQRPLSPRAQKLLAHNERIKQVLNLTSAQLSALRHRYRKKARETLYYRVSRSMAPELESMLRQMTPYLHKISGTNLTQTFMKSEVDRRFQKQANSSNLDEIDFATHAFYEDVMDARDKVLIYRMDEKPLTEIPLEFQIKFARYKGMKLPMRIQGVWKNQSEWFLGGGRLTHRLLTRSDNPFRKRFLESHNVAISGMFYYPPGGYAEWHTNRGDSIGWRLYYIRTSEARKSWFRYKPPGEDKIYLEPDGREQYNIFYLDNHPDKLMWHSVYSDTHRFSIGFHIPPEYVYLVLGRMEGWDVRTEVPY